MVVDANNCKINYFIQGLNQEADRRASEKLTQQLQNNLKMFLHE